MSQNNHLYVTPLTGGLLEKEGLLTLDTVENWHVNGVGIDKVLPKEVCKLSNLEYMGVFLVPAPTFGEVWDLLPNSIPIFLDGKPMWLAYKQLRLDGHNQFREKEMPVESVICYRELIQDGEEILFPEHIIGGNIADAAGRLLLQLHKEGKLDKKGDKI